MGNLEDMRIRQTKEMIKAYQNRIRELEEYLYLKQFEKPMTLEDREKLSPDCLREYRNNPLIIKKFEPK